MNCRLPREQGGSKWVLEGLLCHYNIHVWVVYVENSMAETDVKVSAPNIPGRLSRRKWLQSTSRLTLGVSGRQCVCELRAGLFVAPWQSAATDADLGTPGHFARPLA